MAKKRNNFLNFKNLLESKVHSSLNHLEEFTRGLSNSVDGTRFDILSVTRVDDENGPTQRCLNDTQAGSMRHKPPRKLKRFSISLGKFKLN